MVSATVRMARKKPDKRSKQRVRLKAKKGEAEPSWPRSKNKIPSVVV